MRKSALFTIFILIALIITFLTIYFLNRPIYGNDLDGITKIIKKNGGGRELTVLEPVDLAGSRYAGFFEGDDTIGLLVLLGDGHGNYTYQNIYRAKNASIATFYDAFASEAKGMHGVDIVVSKNPALRRVERYIEGVLSVERTLESDMPAIVVMELHSELNALCVEILCYDVSGTLITDVNADAEKLA